MSDPFYSAGLQFQCTQCHSCCRHDPGYVFLSREDLNRLSTHHSLSPEEFIKKYCRWEDFGTGEMLSLVEKKNFDCIFWDNGCTVYPARPLQCRAYPFWENPMKSLQTWNYEARFCPGINQGKLHSPEVIKQWLKERADSPILTKEEFYSCS
ncbi:MAG: hypothetical protein A2Z96_07745 [Spirochaetes bacterium GWB1_48_6]|nr:MAG: hypothetical protein A2Z96_07745 [Spirochaetes bacterium GWB1_48_6]